MQLKSRFNTPSISLFRQIANGTIFNQLADNPFFDQLFEEEYSRLEEQGDTYLDYAGAAVYGNTQLEKHFELLKVCTFANPHTLHTKSYHGTTAIVEATRRAILEYFEAPDYHCVFTSGSYDASKLLGESYPFDAEGLLLMLADNQKAYKEIKNGLERRRGEFDYLTLKEDFTIDASLLRARLNQIHNADNKLFVLPAQSNVSGVKHDFQWIHEAQEAGWDVFLDADDFVPTSGMSLSTIQPDFVSFSFHKMFGYPSGIGCLLIKKSKFDKLIKTGYTNNSKANSFRPFENVNIDYLALPAVKIGLDYYNRIGIKRIQNRILSMAEYLYNNLRKLKHSSELPIARICGPNDRKKVGGTLILNLFDAMGEQYDDWEIGNLAYEKLIAISTSSFCSPALLEQLQIVAHDDIYSNYELDQFESYNNIEPQINHLKGAVRVSVGIATRKKDLDRFIDFVASFKDSIRTDNFHK